MMRQKIERAMRSARDRTAGLADTDAAVMPAGDLRALIDAATIAFALMEDAQRDYQRMIQTDRRPRDPRAR